MYRLPAGWQLIDNGGIEIGLSGHRECSGYRRRRHDELVRVTLTRFAFLPQRHALMHTEAMLFIDDDQCELFECNAFLKQGMRPNDKRRASVRDSFE